MSLYSNSIFWVEVEKIVPNPYQPRREFEEAKLQDLADSIRQYGVLQPLVVSRVEKEKEDGGLYTEYELIAGERRLRASKIAGIQQVPVLIRQGDDSKTKLELAIIENLQREDLNAVDRARAFLKLVEEFKFTHAQVGARMGKSREYVSNTLRLMMLPEEILNALSAGKITEGHTRPLMMLTDRKDEQMTLFKEILFKKVSVRDAERIARGIAKERARKKDFLDNPEIVEIEGKLRETLGTRVHIERKEVGGHIKIDFFSPEDLKTLYGILAGEVTSDTKNPNAMLERFISKMESAKETDTANLEVRSPGENGEVFAAQFPADLLNGETSQSENLTPEEAAIEEIAQDIHLFDDRDAQEIRKSEEEADLYNINNFSV